MIKGKKKMNLSRGAGILLPISSLPTNYGIGTLGKSAYRFVDFLEEGGQRYWQVLPMGPTSYGDSPYQSFSAFAGNPYFIDLDYLIQEQLLTKAEVNKFSWGNEEGYVDYNTIYKQRFQILKIAYQRSNHKKKQSYKDFCVKNQYWLNDYSLYMALKFHFKNVEWIQWDEDIRYRKEAAIQHYSKLLSEEIEFWIFCQYEFYHQWDQLKTYANEKNIQIIGDIPLYVSMDSADVWVHGELFELDKRRQPINVAGVPPDAFSDDGQRWGNPLYRWDVMEGSNFNWWRERMKANTRLYDIIRIDHFIGIVRYFSIPASHPTAIGGKWKKGPGRKLTDIILESIGDGKIIAEDLGVIVPSVKRLLRSTGFPGMKVLQFAFDGGSTNDYLPHNYENNNIVLYSGTHDNETMVGFLNNCSKEKIQYICSYLDVKQKKNIPDKFIQTLYASHANVAICQGQDLLKLDNNARMNVPSTLGLNWRWRMTKEQFESLDPEKLKKLAILYGRWKGKKDESI